MHQRSRGSLWEKQAVMAYSSNTLTLQKLEMILQSLIPVRDLEQEKGKSSFNKKRKQKSYDYKSYLDKSNKAWKNELE